MFGQLPFLSYFRMTSTASLLALLLSILSFYFFFFLDPCTVLRHIPICKQKFSGHDQPPHNQVTQLWPPQASILQTTCQQSCLTETPSKTPVLGRVVITNLGVTLASFASLALRHTVVCYFVMFVLILFLLRVLLPVDSFMFLGISYYYFSFPNPQSALAIILPTDSRQ